MSIETTIQHVRDGLISDLLKLAHRHEPLRKSSPQRYASEVKKDIHLYLADISTHPTMLDFYSLCHVRQDEFIRDVTDTVMMMLFGSKN